jgi:hypothetical protein
VSEERSAIGTGVETEAAQRPVSALAALTLVLAFPARTFARLVSRPHWVLPIVFVAVAAIVNRLVAIESGLMDSTLAAQAGGAGPDIASARAAASGFAILTGVVSVPAITLLQSVFLGVAGRIFGGRARFVTVLSAVSYASVPVGCGVLLLAALFPFTKSPELGANLSFLVDPSAHPYLWNLAMQLDLFSVWFFILTGIASEPVFRLPRRRARLAALSFAVFFVLLMSWLGVGTAVSRPDPYAGWAAKEVDGTILHFPEGTSPGVVSDVTAAVQGAEARLETALGPDLPRIDCYVYPSLELKREFTRDPAAANADLARGAVHIAWLGSPRFVLAREMANVAGAKRFGKMYNAFLRDGLVVYAGRTWSGGPVDAFARGLLDDGELPSLRDLAGPRSYEAIKPTVSNPVAGSFTSFAVASLGSAGYTELVSRVARRGMPLTKALTSAFGDSLGGIERRWHAFLEGGEAPAGG